MRATLVGGFSAKVPRLTPARVVALLAGMLGAVVALGLAASAASAETFSNDNDITINDSSEFCFGGPATAPGKADPYPSEIAVSGLGSFVTDVNVTISGLSHAFPDEVDMLLVGPQGQRTLLMTDSGGFAGFGSPAVDLTFDDEAPNFVPDPIATGSYKPTVGTQSFFEDCVAPPSFPSPAPAGPYGSSLSVFDGTDPNGTWSLYVIDDTLNDAGSITGWSLDISATTNTAPTAVDDSYSTNKDTTLSVAASEGVLANDRDPEGDTLSAVLVSGPAHGTLALNANGSFTYTPAANFFGTDTFTYKANDGSADSNVARVSITVTAPTTKAQCKNGGWKAFGFPDQGTCITFVNENRP